MHLTTDEFESANVKSSWFVNTKDGIGCSLESLAEAPTGDVFALSLDRYCVRSTKRQSALHRFSNVSAHFRSRLRRTERPGTTGHDSCPPSRADLLLLCRCDAFGTEWHLFGCRVGTTRYGCCHERICGLQRVCARLHITCYHKTRPPSFTTTHLKHAGIAPIPHILLACCSILLMYICVCTLYPAVLQSSVGCAGERHRGLLQPPHGFGYRGHSAVHPIIRLPYPGAGSEIWLCARGKTFGAARHSVIPTPLPPPCLPASRPICRHMHPPRTTSRQ